MALVLALRATRGNLLYVCDRLSVYEGWHAKAWQTTKKPRADMDLWREIQREVKPQTRAVLVLWTESHIEEKDCPDTLAARFFCFRQRCGGSGSEGKENGGER